MGMIARRVGVPVVSVMLVLSVAGTASAATLIGDFKLKGGVRNSAGTKVSLVKVGDVSFETTDVKGKTRKALRFDEGEGLRLKNVPRKARGTYSVSILFEFDAVDGYRRIMSFGPNDRDEGLYIEDAYLDLYDNVESEPVASADGWMRVHVTRLGRTGRMNVYVDGTKKLTHLDTEGEYKLRKGVSVLFQDNLTGGGTEEHPSGTAAAVKVWRGVKAP